MDKYLPHIVEETKRIARIDAIISLLNTEIEVGIERAEVREAKIEKKWARGARSAPLARGPVGAPRFPYVTPVEIPVVEYTENPDPHWLVGFVNGEGRLRGCEGGDKFLQALVCMQGFSCLPPTS